MRAAEASCGDWLEHQVGDWSQAGIDYTGSRAVEESPANAAPQGSRSIPFPCRGPLCQRAPQPAAPPAPHQVQISPREQVCFLAPQDVILPAWSAGLLEENSGSPQDGYPPRIKRPPRVEV